MSKKAYLHFGDRTFPNPFDPLEASRAVSWIDGEPDKKQQNYLSSCLSAYRALIYMTQKERNYICEQIKEQVKCERSKQ